MHAVSDVTAVCQARARAQTFSVDAHDDNECRHVAVETRDTRRRDVYVACVIVVAVVATVDAVLCGMLNAIRRWGRVARAIVS